jgi:hypothetical protein
MRGSANFLTQGGPCGVQLSGAFFDAVRFKMTKAHGVPERNAFRAGNACTDGSEIKVDLDMPRGDDDLA